MRPVLLDGGERQHGNPADGIGPATSCQVMSIQWRSGSVIGLARRVRGADNLAAARRCRSFRRLPSRVSRSRETGIHSSASCTIVAWLTKRSNQCRSWQGFFASTLVGIAAWAAATPASAQALDKVTFGTNWVAEAEHGGFYQALADGTYRRYGLDVTIRQGGPNVNNRILLPVGKIDFFLSANTIEGFDAVAQNLRPSRSPPCSRRTRKFSSPIPTRASTRSPI